MKFEYVSDSMPEQVDNVGIWQNPIKKYNLTGAQALKLVPFAASLGPNFVPGRAAAVAQPGTGAPAILIDVAVPGFKELGTGDLALNYQQEVRVLSPGGWKDAILEFGRLVEVFRGPGTAKERIARIQDILTGETSIDPETGQTSLVQIPEADFLFQIHDVQVAVDNACQNLITRFRV